MTAMPPPSEIDKVRSDSDVWVHLGVPPRKVGDDAGSSASKPGLGPVGSSTAASASQPGLSSVGSEASLDQPGLCLVGSGASGSGGGGGSNGGGGDDGGAVDKPQRSCVGCQKHFRPNELLLDGGDTEKGAAWDWQGRTWDRCFDCYLLLNPKMAQMRRDEAAAEFKRLVRKAWRLRDSGRSKQRDIARATNFRKTLEGIKASQTDLPDRMARKLAMVALTKVIDDVHRQLLAMDSQFQQTFDDIFIKYVKEKDREAAEPGYVASPHGNVASVEDGRPGGSAIWRFTVGMGCGWGVTWG
jgi:hypothetical protein